MSDPFGGWSENDQNVPARTDSPAATQIPQKWPGLLSPFLKAFLVKAPEYGVGAPIAGLHEYTPGKLGDFFQNLGERISNVPSEALRQEVAETSSIPWFENDGDPWYSPLSWSPTRLPQIASKAMSMFGENVPLMLQTAGTSWVGRKVLGGAMGATAGLATPIPGDELALTAAGAFASDLVFPSVMMGLGEARNFAKQGREGGIDEDIAAKYARIYGPASGFIETMQSYTAFGARAAGKSGKLVDPKAMKGMRFTLSKLLSMGGLKLPSEVEEGLEEVSQSFVQTKLMEKAVEDMKARYGANWEPTKPLTKYSLADAANDFAGGALISGMMRGVGLVHRLSTGRVDQETEAKTGSVLHDMLNKPAATYASTVDELIQGLADIKKTDTGKKGGLSDQEREVNERIEKINAVTRSGEKRAQLNVMQILSKWEAGDKQGARDEFAKQAGISAVVPDGAQGEEIMEWIKKRGAVSSIEEDGRRYIIGTPDLISTPEDALRFSGIAKVEADYADRSKWTLDIDVADRGMLAQALSLPVETAKDGTVKLSDEHEKQLTDVQKGLQAMLGSELFTKNNGTVRINFAGRLRMTPAQLIETGNEHILNEQNKTAEKITVKMGGSNRIEKDGRPVLEMFPHMTAYHVGEEAFELAMKLDTKEAGAFQTTLDGVFERVGDIIAKQASLAESNRRQVTSTNDPEEQKQILSTQIEELVGVAERGALPADMIRENEIKRTKSLRNLIENMDAQDTVAIEKTIRKIQGEYGKSTLHDRMFDLNAWVTRARDARLGKASRRELLAKMWALQQMGGSNYVNEEEKKLIQYLHFTPTEAKAVEGHLRKLIGDASVDWMIKDHFAAKAKALPIPVEPVAAKKTSFTMQDEAAPAVKSETDKKIDTLVEQNALLASKVDKLVEALSGRPVSQSTADASSASQVPTPAVTGAPSPEANVVAPEAVEGAIPVEPGQNTPPAAEAVIEPAKPLTDASSIEEFEAEFAKLFAAQAGKTGPATDDDDSNSLTISEQKVREVRDEKSTTEESADDEGVAKSQVVGANASQKFEMEAVRYNPILLPLKAVVGSQARVESIMLKVTKDPEFVIAMDPDDPMNAKDTTAGLKAYLEPKPSDRYEQKSFKGLVSAWLKSGTKESKEKGIELLRSLQRFYSVYEPVPNGYYALGKAGWSGLSDDQFRPMNRFNRTEEFTKSIQARLASVFNSPADLQRIREQLAALPDYAEQDRPGLSKVLADLYGIPAAMLDSISLNATWKGLGLGLRKVRTVFKSSMINEQGWQDVVDMMLKEPVTGGRSNLRNIILASSEEEGLSLHGHDQSNKNIVTAMVSSPALRALNAMLKPGERVDQLVRYIRGVRNTDNTGIEWDEMDDYQRLCVELAESLQGPAGHGFYRVVPLGDKTDGFFMRYKRWTGDEGIAEYARLYKALPARAKELFQTPEELTAAAAQAPTVLRPNAKPDQIDAGLFQSMTVSAAIANLDMYQKLYGNLDMYGFNQDKIMKRGSQIPSGGATYPKKIKALFVKGIGGKLKLGDGAIFHSGAFAAEFKRQMGSEYNPDVIKPYIRGLNFGVKCASYNIDMLKDVDAEAYRSLVALFKANPDVTHIIDETSVKFSEGLTWADAFKSDMKLNPEANLNAAKLEIEAGSMFLVQNIDKSAEAVKGLLSRQMIFATSHLPRAGMREKIAMDIIDALYRQFQDTKLALDAEGKPVNGTLAEKVLADALKGDRNESLRKALLENKERQDSLLNNSAVVSSIFSLMRKMMEPKVNTHSGVQVPAFDLNLPGFEKDGSGRNHLPWNRSNLKVKAGKEWIAPRAAQSFIEKGDALAELREHWEKYLDLAVIDSEGKPVLDEKGKPTFRNEIVRKHAKKFWIPGTVDWSARIPSDSLLSAAPYRWMGPIQAGSDAGLAMITEAGRKANGADFDADSLFNATYFVDEQGNPYFTTAEDASDERKIRAMMNRRLNLLVADYQETDLNYLISESADGKKNKDTDIEDLKDMLKALAKGYKAKASYKMNSRSFAEQAMNVFAAGTRMLGIAAKGNSAFDVESTNGVYWEQEIDLGNGLKLSLPKEEADRLMSPAGFKDRMYRKNVIGRAMVNFLVDDPSDPHAGYLFTYDTLPLALAAMQGVKLTPANVAAELTKIVEFLKSPIIAGPNGYIEVLQAQRFTGERGPGLFNEMLVKTYGEEKATELLKLIAVSRSRMVIGRISDFAVAGKRPNDMARLDAFTEDIANIEANRLYGVAVSPRGFLWAANQVNPEKKNTLTKVYNVGELAKSQTFAMSKKYVESIKAQAETGMTRAVEDTVKEVLAGEYVDLRVRKDVREAIQRASAVKAIAPVGFDASGAPAAFQALSSAYPQGHAARAFLDRLIANKQEIQLVPSWRTGDFKAKDMEAAQAGWDALSPEHQTLLAAYQFNKYGIGDSMWRGGYMPLIGWKWRAATTQALSDPSLLMGSDIQAFAARMIPHADPQTGEKGWIPKSVREQFFVPNAEVSAVPIVQPAPESNSLTWANAVDRVAFSLPAYNRKAYNRTWKPIVARIQREAKTKADIARFIRVFDIEEHLAKNLRDLSADYPEAPERDPLFDQARTRELLQQSVPLMQAGLQSLQFNEADQDRIIKATLDQFRKHPARGIEAMQEILGKVPLVAELRRLTTTDSHSLVISPMARNFNDIDTSMYFKSPIDGDLRAEIPFRFTFKENADFEAGNPVPIRDVIDLQDPDIEKSYPELLDMEVMKRSFETPLYGQYVPEFKSDAPHIELNSTYSPRMMQAILTHEIQHAIQDIEGRLTPSGNIAKTQGYEAYLNVPSEVEARYAERRMGMDQGQIESNLRGEVPELSYSMTPVVDNLSTIQQVSSGKYGMHKAYYTAQEEIQASSVEMAFHVDKWRKVIPKKDAATWELITRWIDDEPAYRDRFNALDPKAQAVAREVKQFFVAKRDEFNDTLSGFSTHEWMSYRDNFINRIYAKKAGSAQTKARPIETKHTTRRVFDTLKEAEADGYVLAEKDAAELAMIYAGEVKRSAQTRLMLAQGFAVRDQLDNAHLIPVFAGEPNIRPSMKTLAKSSAQEAADTMSAENGEEYKGSSSWNAIKTALEKITGRYDPAKRGYIRMESPFAEYESFWVHPDSLGVVKSMLNDRWGSQIMKQVERVNAWSRFMTLGFSLFHTIAIWENVVSTLQGDAFKMKNGRLRFAWKNDEQFTKLMEDPTFVGNWIRRGLTTTPYPNIDMGVISQDLTKIKAWAEQRNNKAVGAMVKSMIKYKEFTDKHLWQNFNSMSKVYAAWKFYNMRTEQLQQQGKTWNEDDLKTQIAQGVNVTFGDLAWHRFIWATPKVKQFLRLTVFAPDWTLSNIEIARAGIANIPGLGAVLGKGLSNETRRLAITRAWPGMLIFMLGWPNVVQAMIYAAFGGSPDDDDRIFAAQNEKGKEFSVDVTPAFRKFGWTSKDNPKERFYMRFAKQSWEVVEAVENPLQTMKGKSSALVKIAMEQVTGENMIGWDTPFKKETFWGGMLYSHERGFMGSRAGTIVEKFMPMAVVSYLGGKPPSWLAPVGKGMTQSSAEREISKVLTAYADPGVWEKITGTPDYEAKLDALVPEVIEAAQRNGVNVKEAVKRATSNVLGKHYDAFWKALNRNDAQGLEDAAASIVRVHGSLRTVYQSMGAKGKRINRPLDPQRRSIVQQFMLDAQRKPTRQEEHAWFMDQIRNPVTDDEE